MSGPCGSLRNQFGISIVETLVAAGLISVSALGLTASLKEMGTVRERSNLMGRAVALESSLVAAIVDPNNYPPEVQAELQAGRFPENFNLVVQIPSDNDAGFSSITLPTHQTVLFCYQGREFVRQTSSADCPNESYKIRIEGRAFGVAMPAQTTPDTRFAFAYYFAANLAEGIGFRSFGSPLETFQDSDFRTALPLELYRSWNEQMCGTSELLIRGVVRDSGQPICMLKDDTACPPGRFATGLEVVNGVMRLRCSAPTLQVGCPANYNLRSFNPQSLVSRPGGTVQGVCVYAAQNSEGFSDIAGVRIQGQACPQGYQLAAGSSCVVRATLSEAGTCVQQTWVAGAEVNEGRVVDPNNPANDCDLLRTTYMSSPVPTVAEPVAGQLISSSVQGQSVNCEIQVPPQPCDARWEGQVVLAGACELQLPETRAATEVAQ